MWDQDNGLTDLGLQPAHRYNILDFNNSGSILYLRYNEKNEAKLYIDFSPLGSIFSEKDFNRGTSINDSGEIFGFADVQNGLSLRYFNPKTKELEDIFVFKGQAGDLHFNNKGVAIGSFCTRGQYNHYGFIWSRDTGIQLFPNFLPACLNDVGQIIWGGRAAGSFSPTMLVDGNKVDINQALDLEFDLDTPWQSVETISDINNNGQMVGDGILFGEQCYLCPHAVLLVPSLVEDK